MLVRGEARRDVLRYAWSRREASTRRGVRTPNTTSPSTVEVLSRKKKVEPKLPIEGSVCDVCGKPTDEHNNLAYMRCMILGYQRPQDIQPAKTSGTLSGASG